MNKFCLVVVVLSLATFVAADNVDLTITVDNTIEELYIDGIRIPNSALPNRFNWPAVDVVSIPDTAQVVAVYGSDYGVVAGILLSAAGDLLVTDGSWKCVSADNVPSSSTESLDWYMPDYDDSQWPAASVILANPNGIHGDIASISHNAKWIWTAAGIQNSRVLCRGRMNDKPADTVDLTITVDNVLEELYIDGTRISNSALPNRLNWPAVDVLTISKATQVVAVYGSDYGVVAGILASAADDLLVTDDSWKCVDAGNVPSTSTPSLAWYMPDYDDSQWPAASVILANPNGIHGDIASISHNAKWIWTAAGIQNSRVLCRGRMTPPPVYDECSVDVDDRVECGWPGISPEACLARVGCCFDDSIEDEIWCYQSTEYSQAVCAVDPDDRVECGWPGIPREVCLSHPQCCFDDSIDDVKWCFHQHDYEYTVRSEVCDIEPEDRVECGWPGILITECLSHAGCCFDDSIDEVLWCFHQKQEDCNVWPAERDDCGWPGISAGECESRGCCFDDTYDETIWCFYKNKVMLPECVEYPPWKREECGSSDVSECQMDQDSCCYDDTYSFQDPPFCYKQLDICDVALDDREDCGWEGITADRCLARGCCFDDSQDGIWCYRMPTPVIVCDVAVEDREDCGYEGITADRCLARRCCFDDSQDGPWCYYRP